MSVLAGRNSLLRRPTITVTVWLKARDSADISYVDSAPPQSIGDLIRLLVRNIWLRKQPGRSREKQRQPTPDRGFVSCIPGGNYDGDQHVRVAQELTATRGPSQLMQIAADTLGWSLSGSGFSASLTFDYRDVAIDRQICEAFSSSSGLWPFDLKPVQLGSLAQAEDDAWIVRGQIAAAGDFHQ